MGSLEATELLDRRQAAAGGPLTMSNPSNQSRSANGRLLYRQGFADHIQKLQVAGGSGVWLPSETAAFAGVRAGGQVALALNGRRLVARVAGVYKDLNRLPVTPFWCSQGSLIYAAGLGSEIPAPPIFAEAIRRWWSTGARSATCPGWRSTGCGRVATLPRSRRPCSGGP